MIASTIRIRPLLAIAGVAAGVASVAIAPSGASAQATDETPPVTWNPEGQPAAGPVPASHGTCLGNSQGFTSDGLRYILPTTSNGSHQTHCTLVRGNTGPGVLKLQEALNRCNNRESLATDQIYGAQTEAAVRRVQERYGLPVDGRYGPMTRSAMFWPGFNNDSVQQGCSRLSLNP